MAAVPGVATLAGIDEYTAGSRHHVKIADGPEDCLVGDYLKEQLVRATTNPRPLMHAKQFKSNVTDVTLLMLPSNSYATGRDRQRGRTALIRV